MDITTFFLKLCARCNGHYYFLFGRGYEISTLSGAPFQAMEVVLVGTVGTVVLQGKMGYTMEKVPWHEGWIAMMLYIAIEERERESHRLPLPPSRCDRKCSIYVEKSVKY